MIDIEYDFGISGDAPDDAFLDPQAIEYLFAQTQQDLGSSLQRRLAGVVCREHGHPPRLRLIGRYDQAAGEMDIQYHIDTCCPLFLARVIKTLNTRG
ncbi:MAG: hypothetical protein MUE40_11605 [Anaerolineae bacterium]|jgi:hypothetical protein|nr:hypothetical protein [Anaerolineae bacterium]